MNIPNYLPLTGSDFFSLTMEHGMSRVRAPGNVCRMVLQFDGPVDADSLRSAINESGFMEWMSNVRWSRPLPFMTPRWKLNGTKNSLFLREHEAPECNNIEELLPYVVGSQIVSPFKPPAFAFDLLHHPSKNTTLVFTWHHALMDARGAELLITLIGNSSKTGRENNRPIAANAPPSLWNRFKVCLKFPQRVYYARTSIHAVVKSCRPPIASIHHDGSDNLEKTNGSQFFKIISFDSNETGLIENNSVLAGANFRNSLFYLAAVIRAVDKVLTDRGCKPTPYVVPVPLDIRKRGCPGPVVTNHITFLFYRAEPEDVKSMKGLVKSLREQMTKQIRNRTPESFTITMELFRNLPLGLFALQTASTNKGQVASFYFSYTGESCSGLEQFIGRPVRMITHIPPVSFPPGLSVFFTKHRGKLFSVLSLMKGCFNEQELSLLETTLRSELLEIN